MIERGSNREVTSLDPADWDEFRDSAHKVLDRCIDRFAQASSHPWQPVPDEVADGYRISGSGSSISELSQRLIDGVLPFGTGNTHPAFFGWVHGSGLASGILSEVVAATMNSNCGGRDHGAIYLERAVVDWSKKVFGLPSTASGVLVTGTSQATVLALAAARIKALGRDVRKTGLTGQHLTAYAGAGSHASIAKAVELLGIGSDNLRLISETESGLNADELAASIAEDRRKGALPFAVVGTAGSVDLGRFDDLARIATVASQEDLWFHVDGAFGAWLQLTDPPLRNRVSDISRADSIACDFHKWLHVPYDCGLCLMRDEAAHRAAFARRPAYLQGQESGLGGGEPWYCDFGTDLSRGNRALKVWTALELYGVERLGKSIERNCHHAAYMARLVEDDPKMKLVSPVQSNICVFTADGSLAPKGQSELNDRIAADLQLEGTAVFSTTHFDGVHCLRAAITNHRTDFEDIDSAIMAVARRRDVLAPES